MTLDEAIEHADRAAQNCDGECAEEHWQLAEWLRELRRARMEIDLLKTLRDGFKADAQKYKAENAKLRELVCAQRRLTDAVHDYWSDVRTYPDSERAQAKLTNVLNATRQVDKMCDELGIEVDDEVRD